MSLHVQSEIEYVTMAGDELGNKHVVHSFFSQTQNMYFYLLLLVGPIKTH